METMFIGRRGGPVPNMAWSVAGFVSSGGYIFVPSFPTLLSSPFLSSLLLSFSHPSYPFSSLQGFRFNEVPGYKSREIFWNYVCLYMSFTAFSTMNWHFDVEFFAPETCISMTSCASFGGPSHKKLRGIKTMVPGCKLYFAENFIY